jgi:hypothetical protein
MTRRIFFLASALLALATFALGTIGTTSIASAQLDTCCVRIDNNTTCHITICVKTATGTIRCETIMALANGGFRFPCRDTTTHFAVVNDACGLDHRLRVNECIRVHLRGEGDCCALVCLREHPDGCFRITIDPIPGPCPCP